ncbi:head maturation protease, ClpP-related [Schaalia sp. lx-100]|uniref:head maturation protease, ClpP-related n=1 Tax=Schaalia sp. lx-100 TaxID=2899081 RepID=UPI001E61A208|nr:head maturation protease, ClpP-related [Schaalia sp. lx-100]MCD4556978.1 Clp protease ClpP [Schaalia sp. lx-100]
MTVNRFWNWEQPPADPPGEHDAHRVLRIGGVIAADSWFDDDVTPGIFRSELEAGSGPIQVWINSPGGDCVAAAEIYTMLMDYPYPVTVIIDALAASAASVIAMAGTEVLISPVGMMMIHNPATLATGDATELSRAVEMLSAVKESIINAYELRTGMQRAKLARLMDEETWMDAKAAINLGFADGLYQPSEPTQVFTPPAPDPEPDADAAVDSRPVPVGAGFTFSAAATTAALVNKINHHQPTPPPVRLGRRIADLYAALANQPH